MKYLILILPLFSVIGLKAQTANSFSESAIITPYQLDITWNKTSLLIFPAEIKSADRGGSYVLAEKVKGVNNVLKVKAGQKDFEPSNLQVITADGKVYPFTVHYIDSPAALTIDLRKQSPFAPVAFKGLSLNSKEIEQYAGIVAAANPLLDKGKFKKYGIELLLDGIFIKNDVLFIRYNLKNTTRIPYADESIRFFVRDKKKSKRTAEQDKESEPVFIHRLGTPEEQSGQTIVAVFPKFTIAESKYFSIEIMEKGGDRNPSSKLDQKLILKAKALR